MFRWSLLRRHLFGGPSAPVRCRNQMHAGVMLHRTGTRKRETPRHHHRQFHFFFVVVQSPRKSWFGLRLPVLCAGDFWTDWSNEQDQGGGGGRSMFCRAVQQSVVYCCGGWRVTTAVLREREEEFQSARVVETTGSKKKIRQYDRY